MKLPVADREIVAVAEAGNVRHRIGGSDVAAALADHEAQFAFPIERLADFRQMHRRAGTRDARRHLREDDGAFRDLGVRLRRVVAVVQSDREHLSRMPHRRFESDIGQGYSRLLAGRAGAGAIHYLIAGFEERDHVIWNRRIGGEEVDYRIVIDDRARPESAVVAEGYETH